MSNLSNTPVSYQSNIVIITSDQLRHRYFINHLNHHFPISAVFLERFRYPEPPAADAADTQAWNWFFSRRAQYEKKALGDSDNLSARNNPAIIRVAEGQFNSRPVLDLLKKHQPGLIAIYGTGILGPEILDHFPGKIFNLHVGLPAFYRGSSCNFWPIYNRELECLGASTHLVDAGIDAGQVFAQETIAMETSDDEQILMGKTLILGTRLMIDTLKKWRAGNLKPVAKNRQGKLYLMKDFTPKAVSRVKQMVESGELGELIRKTKAGAG